MPSATLLSAVALAVVATVALVLFSRRALLLYRLVRMGAPLERFDELPKRVENEVVVVLGQKKLLQRLVPGLVHAFIFWGFVVLFPTIVIAAIYTLDRRAAAARRDRRSPGSSVRAGSRSWSTCSRASCSSASPPRSSSARCSGRSDSREATCARRTSSSALIAGIVSTLLLWHATQIALGLNEWPADWSPVSDALSQLFSGGTGTEVLERVFVWAHVLIILSFLVYLPYSKHLHIATAGPNVFFGRTRPPGRLEPLRFEGDDDELRFGAGTVADMTWKGILDTMSCTECGRCQDVCPAYATGKKLSPKLLIMDLRDHVFAEGPKVLAGDGFQPSALVPNAVLDEVIWDCVTCGACVRECPVAIEHVDHIVDLRRHLVMVESRFPAESEPMLRDIERSSNPWGKPQGERAAWADGLGVRVLEPGDEPPEVLYWVGLRGVVRRACAPLGRVDGEAPARRRARRRHPRPARVLHRRSRPAHRQRVRVPGVRGVERGDAERDRRDEDRRQLPALLQHARERVPGLRRALRGDAPHGAPRRARPRRPARTGRERRDDHVPRLLLPLPPQRRRSRRRASSSAGSGGRSRWRGAASARSAAAPAARTCGWRSAARAINEERVREAAETGAETLAVACPFCTIMLDDGVRQTGRELRVADVSTLLAEALDAPLASPRPIPEPVPEWRAVVAERGATD